MYTHLLSSGIGCLLVPLINRLGYDHADLVGFKLTLSKVWDLETNECIRILEDHDNTVCTLVVASGYLFSGSYTHLKVILLAYHFRISTDLSLGF